VTPQGNHTPPPDREIPISRAVGRFFGHLWNAATTPVEPKPPKAQKTRHTREEHPASIDGKPVILRRTTIEEIEFRDDGSSQDHSPE